MKKIFLIVCIVFVIFSGCSNAKVVNDISETVKIETESNISESVKVEIVNNVSEPVKVEIVNNVSEPDKNENMLKEEVLKTELISMGLLREPTVVEKQQYEVYEESVKEYIEDLELCSKEKMKSDYTILLGLIESTNKELGTNALVYFDGKSVEPAVLPIFVAKRTMLIIPCDENYEERYRAYEEQYELCYDINSECSRALTNKDYYNYVKLLHNYSIEEEKLLEMEKNLE